MKKRLQGVLAGVLIGAMLTSGAAFAKQLSEAAQLVYNDIKISLNGKEIQPTDVNGNYVEPFIIDGTTYLPVRAVANALGIDVNWDGSTNTVLLSNQDAETIAEGFDASSVAKELKVTKEYCWDTQYTHYLALVIKNDSAYTVSPKVQVSFKDATGNVVEESALSDRAFGPGSERAFVFNTAEAFSSYEYSISAEEEDKYDECVSKLECTYSTIGNTVTLQIKNNGTKAAKSVEFTILYKNRGKVVASGWAYAVDDDFEIKPGMTKTVAYSAYKETFDSVEIYLTGRADK